MKSTFRYIIYGIVWLAGGASAFPGASFHPAGSGAYRCNHGHIQFRSRAPLEVIEAESNNLRGAVDPENQTFAWSVEVISFEGFNGPLQREHFNENYLESTRYPQAVFTGKIIEKIDFSKDGDYSVRAKGKLNIHGVEQERIIKGLLEIKGSKIHVETSFIIPLTDHNITIPKIVHQKIAEEIMVTVDADLDSKN